jgi:polyhydroxybutyrate depolymerase
MARSFFRTALSCATLAIAACATPAAITGTASAEPVLSEKTMQHDGRTRSYLVHDFSNGKMAPVVFILHGGGGNAENAVMMSGFDAVAAREHLIAVYPAGTGGLPGGRVLTWNAGHCCAYAMEKNVDDVGFISAIIDDLVASGKADPKRIYVSGMSNGGMMSHRLALALPGKIAAIAPVVGALFGDEQTPKSPPFTTLSVLMIVGANDSTVQAGGGPLAGGGNRAISRLARKPEDRDIISTRAAADFWAKANGCTGPAESTTPAAATLTYAKCRDGAEVTLVSVANNGHAWPGGKPGRAEADPPSQAWNASEEMWAFFKRHPHS